MSDIKDVVKEKYGQAALRVVSGEGAACCGSSPSSCCSGGDPITSDLYDSTAEERAAGDGRAGVARLRQSDGAWRS